MCFQSHLGLILTLAHNGITRNGKEISIPSWSDFNTNVEEIVADDKLTFNPILV